MAIEAVRSGQFARVTAQLVRPSLILPRPLGNHRDLANAA